MKNIFYFLFGFLFVATILTWGERAFLTRQTVSGSSGETSAEQSLVGIPERLFIPKLGVEAKVETVGLTDQGAMEVPLVIGNVGWYKFGAKPGEAGNAVIAGHFDGPTGPSVFYRLSSLTPGDKVSVIDDKGQVYTFVVAKKDTYPDSNFPILSVFGKNQRPMLNLITCTGPFDRQSKNYLDRLVVYTYLQEENQ
jgi:LPXTG-site transpeptidase (sortase) family protein